MMQTAIFVDAGYVYAQGCVALESPRTERRNLRLNPNTMTQSLRELAEAIEPDGRLLRIYWYDGLARGAVMNADQDAIWRTEGVKCRFGTINTHGQQKGVDSLIVTDLIDLARLQAISDAVIVSGDEDVRIGVQVAQNYGIRVHLLGIHPAKGSQSVSLIAEADTHHEWGKERVEKWLTVVKPQVAAPEDHPLPQGATETDDWIAAFVAGRVAAISPNEATSIHEYAMTNQNQLPSDFDRPTLATARNQIGREVSFDERKQLRVALRVALEKRAADEC